MEIKYTNIIYIPDKKVTTLKINNIIPYYCEISFLKFKHFEFNISFIFFPVSNSLLCILNLFLMCVEQGQYLAF